MEQSVSLQSVIGSFDRDSEIGNRSAFQSVFLFATAMRLIEGCSVNHYQLIVRYANEPNETKTITTVTTTTTTKITTIINNFPVNFHRFKKQTQQQVQQQQQQQQKKRKEKVWLFHHRVRIIKQKKWIQRSEPLVGSW